MKAGAKSLRFLGEGKKLSIPFFQRRYVWEKSNWEELLETFENREVMPFLGSIILKERDAKESVIVDGQQRLTTITILAKAIYDCLSDESKLPGSGIRNCIENFLYYRNNAADDFADSHIRIEHSRIDREDYNRVVESRMLHSKPAIDLDTINDDSGNVLRCYKYYCEKLQFEGDKQLKELFNSIFDEDRKVFVLIELEHNDINEQTIFDTINRAGIRLSTADIIKNNLFKRLLDACGNDEAKKKAVLKIYKDSWEDVFNQNQKESELWDEERVFGNVKHNNLEFLLYCIACIKWGEDSDMFSKLENVFDRETSQIGFGELQNLVNEIKAYALIFKKYILDFKDKLENEDADVYFKYEDGVRRLLLILQRFRIQMFYPYVLMRLKEVNENDSDPLLLEDFKVLESFVMRRKISSRGTHDYTSKCYSIIKNGINTLVESDLGADNAGISDSDVKQYLSETKDDDAKMILFWIELFRRSRPGYDVDALEFKYTLEHIMPKKWEPNWSSVPIVENGVILDQNSEKGMLFRKSMIQSLGNKTLLTSSLNSTVKNSCFRDKVNGINDNKPGYKKHTSLLLTQELVKGAETDMTWDEAHIAKRLDQLYKEFIQIWPSFKERMPHTPTNEEGGQDADISQYTPEQLADPVKLLEAMDVNESVDDTDGMISVAEFVQKVNVQSETIEKYIREGKIRPDRIVQASEHRTIKYFKEETVKAYALQFNWTLITDDNRKQVFLDMVEVMDMTYSYKPVLLKAIFEYVGLNGRCSFPKIVKYFLDYYKKRRDAGLFVEKPDSVFASVDCSYADAEHVIMIYPYKRFADIGAFRYDSTENEIVIEKTVWQKLTATEKDHIIDRCNSKLAEYYHDN